MRIFKIVLQASLILVLALVLWHSNLVLYGVVQLKGQLSLINNCEDRDSFLSRHNDSLKVKFDQVDEIILYAQSEMGYQTNDNYSQVFDQKGKPVMWVLSASKPYELKPYLWEFPLVGGFPYKGYFNEQRAQREMDLLKRQGLEVDLGHVNAWSTLGYLEDPILSSMLKFSEGKLARLLLHELTHTNIYVKDSVTWNENFATFIGNHAAIGYLSKKYGCESAEVKEMNRFLSSMNTLNQFFKVKAEELDELYKSNQGLPDEQKQILKTAFFQNMKEEWNHLPIEERTKNRLNQRFNEGRIDNNFLLTYMTYTSQLAQLNEILDRKYKGDLKRMINEILLNGNSLNHLF